jgi:hypothetical protein
MILSFLIGVSIIMIVFGIWVFMDSLISYNNTKDFMAIGFSLIVIGCILCGVTITNLNSYSIKEVSVESRFINSNNNPSTGFLDDQNTEYYYKDITVETNKTYKMKIRLNNDENIRYVEYLYT